MDPVQVEAVRDRPVPKSVLKFRVSLVSPVYYRRFVKNFSKIVGSLSKLIRKGEKFVQIQARRHLRS